MYGAYVELIIPGSKSVIRHSETKCNTECPEYVVVGAEVGKTLGVAGNPVNTLFPAEKHARDKPGTCV